MFLCYHFVIHPYPGSQLLSRTKHLFLFTSTFRNVFPAALDWLIQNDSSVKLLNCDTTTKTIQTTTIIAGNETNEASTSTVERPPPLAEAEPDIDGSGNTSKAPSQCATPSSEQGESLEQDDEEDGVTRFRRKVDYVEALLDIIRQFSDRDVYPTPEMVASIVEMGFNEKNVREALVATRNNQAAAVSCLGCGLLQSTNWV